MVGKRLWQKIRLLGEAHEPPSLAETFDLWKTQALSDVAPQLASMEDHVTTLKSMGGRAIYPLPPPGCVSPHHRLSAEEISRMSLTPAGRDVFANMSRITWGQPSRFAVLSRTGRTAALHDYTFGCGAAADSYVSATDRRSTGLARSGEVPETYAGDLQDSQWYRGSWHMASNLTGLLALVKPNDTCAACSGVIDDGQPFCTAVLRTMTAWERYSPERKCWHATPSCATTMVGRLEESNREWGSERHRAQDGGHDFRSGEEAFGFEVFTPTFVETVAGHQ